MFQGGLLFHGRSHVPGLSYCSADTSCWEEIQRIRKRLGITKNCQNIKHLIRRKHLNPKKLSKNKTFELKNVKTEKAKNIWIAKEIVKRKPKKKSCINLVNLLCHIKTYWNWNNDCAYALCHEKWSWKIIFL